MKIPSTLLAKIQESAYRAPSPAIDCLVREILRRHGEAVQAILYYGSCLRKGDEFEGLVDLYVLVDDYRSANRNSMQAALNRLLPPNVFFLEIPFEGQKVRSKYAVLSLKDLQKGTSHRWFHSYLWGRFSQPTALVYQRSEKVALEVDMAFASAVITFVTRVLPCVPGEFTSRELWRTGLELSYRAEIRTEKPDRQVRLFDAAPGYFEAVTRSALHAVPYAVRETGSANCIRYRSNIPASVRRLSRISWGIRKLHGKALSVLRLIKGMTTFEGGVDYILWKIERHSGVSVTVSPRLRRHPLLAMWVLSWRVYRRGGIR